MKKKYQQLTRIPPYNAYLESKDPQHRTDEPFDEKRGIDILIDQIRYQPKNVTVTKIIVRMVDRKYKDLIKPSGCSPDLGSKVGLPTYNFRMELRKEVEYPNEAFLFLIYITIDKYSETGVPGIVGYSFFPLFLDKDTGEPASPDSKEVLLHDGQYQLPVFCQDYPYALDFDFKRA